MNSETIAMDAIDVREAMEEKAGEMETNEPFTMDDFLKEMKENTAKELEKMDENNGGETMNREFDVREAVKMSMEQPDMSVNNEVQSTNSFIKIKRIDSDSAYERIKILKNSKKKLIEDINNTDCSGMNDSLIALYNDIETAFNTAIGFESLAVASGEQR